MVSATFPRLTAWLQASALVLVCIATNMTSPAQSYAEETVPKTPIEFAQTMRRAIVNEQTALRNLMFMKLRGEKDRSVPHVVKLLEDENEGVVAYALFTLSWLPKERSQQPVIDHTRDERTVVRRAAYRAAGRLKIAEARTILEQAVTAKEQMERRDAVYSLGLLGDEEALPVLKRVAAEDTDETVRFLADEAIKRITETW